MKKYITIFIRQVCVVSLLIFTFSSCATSPTGRSQLMVVSPQSAIAKSKQAYVQVLTPLAKEGKIDNDLVTAKKIRYITGRLVAQAVKMYPHTQNWEWSVKVIDDPKTVNAWCMAGGKMAVYTGLLKKIKPTDDEIAQVMGHEISHALANHTAEKMSTALAAQGGGALLGIGAAYMLGDKKRMRHYISGASTLAAVGVTLPNSRAAEIEADEMGIELATRAGYDPRAAVSLWDKMGKVGGRKIPQWLSTHPGSGNRKTTLAYLAKKLMPYYQQKNTYPVYPLHNTPLR